MIVKKRGKIGDLLEPPKQTETEEMYVLRSEGSTIADVHGRFTARRVSRCGPKSNLASELAMYSFDHVKGYQTFLTCLYHISESNHEVVDREEHFGSFFAAIVF